MTTTPTYDPTSTGFLGADPQVERLYDNIQGTVPAVELAMVKMQIWNTIEDFYIRSTVRRETAYWQMPIGVSSVDFNPFDADWLVCWILGFTGLGRARIDPFSATLYDLHYPTATNRKGEALLVLKPTSFAAELSPMLWSQWFETLMSGVLYRLYGQPVKPYSSPQMAQFHGRRYMSGCASARAIADHGFTDGGGRWLYPYYARGRLKD
jgi:hypothetical protein